MIACNYTRRNIVFQGGKKLVIILDNIDKGGHLDYTVFIVRISKSKKPPFTQGSLWKEYGMNFTTWFVICLAIIVPVATYIFHNKE